MTDHPNRPPLWEVMHEAFWRCPKENWRLSSAYMIRALRDWLVPEEEAYKPVFPSLSDNPLDLIMTSQLAQRRQLRSILTKEAERAEASE